MKKRLLKQATLALITLVLSLSFVPRVSATDSFGAAITKTGSQQAATDEESQDTGKYTIAKAENIAISTSVGLIVTVLGLILIYCYRKIIK